MNKIYTILLLAFLASSSAYAEWRLQNASSSVYYVSTKNISVSELNYFNTLSGAINENGELNIKIYLESVETDIPIRNERIKAMLFEVINYDKATVTATVDPHKLNTLKAGDTYIETVNFKLDLHGITQELSTTVRIVKHINGTILVTSDTPIIIDANQFDLVKGIERLRRIARLESITPTVPVIFNLTFIPK